MTPIKVTVPRRVLDSFRRLAKEKFPRETLAYLLGHRAGESYEVTGLWVPENIDAHVTKQYVFIQSSWQVDAHCHAEDEDVNVIGDIHSHPLPYPAYGGHFNGEPVPSIIDLKGGWPGLAAICAVCEQPDKKLLTRTLFYGPSTPVSKTTIA